MDPITIVGLTASLIEIITFSVRTVKFLRQASTSAGTEEYQKLLKHTETLKNLLLSLENTAAPTSNLPPTVSHTNLEGLIARSGAKARRLLHELEEMRTRQDDGLCLKLRKSLSLLKKRKALKHLQLDLEKDYDFIQNYLVQDIRETCQKLVSGQSSSFRQLSDRQQLIIGAIATGQDNLEVSSTPSFYHLVPGVTHAVRLPRSKQLIIF